MTKKTYDEKDIEILLTSEGLKHKVSTSSKRYYVYTIFGPTLGPLYVGKGAGTRALVHEKQARDFLQENPDLPYESWITSGYSFQLPKLHRIAAHLSYGDLRYKISFFTNNEDKAFKEEKRLIKLYGRSIKGRGILANLAGGGQGAWHSNKGGSTPGHKVSDGTKNKISKALKGRKFSEAHCKAISEALRGRKLSKDIVKKMSEGRRGIPRSEETRRKVSESRLLSDTIKRTRVKVHGVIYRSMREAAYLSGYTYQQIVYRTKISYKGFERL